MRIKELSLLESSIIDLTRHHAGLRSHLGKASELVAAVVLEQRPPSRRAFLSLRRLFLEFSLESQSYLDLEETALIPALRGGNGWETVTDLAETIRMLRFGQQAILSFLPDICEATQGFVTPAKLAQSMANSSTFSAAFSRPYSSSFTWKTKKYFLTLRCFPRHRKLIWRCVC